MRRGLAAAITAAALSIASGAAAQDDAAERARAHFQTGTQRIQEGRWAEAVTELEAARELFATAPVLYNLGIALRGVGRAREAIATFEAFLEELGSEGPADRIAEVRGYVDELRAAIAHVTLELDPPDATVRFDGVAVPTGTLEVELDPGPHQLTARSGRRRLERSITLSHGERRTLSLVLPPAPARLQIDNPVADAVVYVDGAKVGRGVVAHEVEPGEHRVEVRAPSGETFERVVTVEAGQDLRLDADLGGGGSVWESPWLWLALGVAVAAAVAIPIAVVAASGTEEPYVGSLGVVTGVLVGWEL